MDVINSIAAVCASVLSISEVVMGILHYVVMAPLRSAIDRLSETISRLEKSVTDMEITQRELDHRVTIVEQSAKAAHRRIDAITATADKGAVP